MKPIHDPFGLERTLSDLRRVRARTWVMLGTAVVAVLGGAAWAVVAAASWLYGQVPAIAEVGKRFSGEAIVQIEQMTPGLGNELARWLPRMADDAPAADVSGADPGPVTRYPGLVRSQFGRDTTGVEVTYTGDAAFASVLDHYVRGFAAAGFAREVVSATPDAETHRLRRGVETIYLTLARQAAGRVELRLSEHRS